MPQIDLEIAQPKLGSCAPYDRDLAQKRARLFALQNTQAPVLDPLYEEFQPQSGEIRVLFGRGSRAPSP